MVRRISWGDASQGGKAGGVAFAIKISMQLVVVLYFIFSFFVGRIEGNRHIYGSDISGQNKKTLLNKMNMK